MGAPSGVSYSKVGSNISISWTNTALSVVSSCGSAASRSNNRIEKRDSTSSPWVTHETVAATATSYSGDPGVSPTGNWQFRVVSIERYNEWDAEFGICRLNFLSLFSSATSSLIAFSTDQEPNAFNLGSNVTDANLNAYYYSGLVTVAGLGSGVSVNCSISGTGAQFQKNGGSWTTTTTTVSNGDTVRVRILSANARSSGRTATLTIGIGASSTDTWSVTTTSSFRITETAPASGEISMATLRGLFGPKQPTPSSIQDYCVGGAYYDGSFSENTSLPTQGAQVSLSDFHGKKGLWRLLQINPITSEVPNGGTAQANLAAIQEVVSGYIEKDLEFQWVIPNTSAPGFSILDPAYATWSTENTNVRLRLVATGLDMNLWANTVSLRVRALGFSAYQTMSIPVTLRVLSSTS